MWSLATARAEHLSQTLFGEATGWGNALVKNRIEYPQVEVVHQRFVAMNGGEALGRRCLAVAMRRSQAVHGLRSCPTSLLLMDCATTVELTLLKIKDLLIFMADKKNRPSLAGFFIARFRGLIKRRIPAAFCRWP